jgi:hypothetical protein
VLAVAGLLTLSATLVVRSVAHDCDVGVVPVCGPLSRRRCAFRFVPRVRRLSGAHRVTSHF